MKGPNLRNTNVKRVHSLASKFYDVETSSQQSLKNLFSLRLYEYVVISHLFVDMMNALLIVHTIDALAIKDNQQFSHI